MADHDRPLAPRGRRAAERMAEVIAGRSDLLPDRILCSPARRTRETLAPLSARIGDASRSLILDELYEPAAGDYRHVIAAHGGSAHQLLVIGHNPTIQATALGLIDLVGSADDQTVRQIAAKFPTAALAVIDFDTRIWGEIQPKSGRLEAFIRPRDLEADDDD